MANQPDALIFGAGALALGFLGPELYKDWALTFIDIDAKKGLLSHLKDNGKYTVNIAGPFQKAFEVTNVRGLNLNNPPELKEIIQRFSSSKLIFTSVGAANLNSLVPIFCEGINSCMEFQKRDSSAVPQNDKKNVTLSTFASLSVNSAKSLI